MPIFIFAVLINFLRALRTHLRRVRDSKPKSLCAGCFYAHVQYGANAERAISCTFGGSIRSVKLDVLYCTDYQARTLPGPIRMIGFEREVAQTK
ncbi:MAG TPA: hypothetical protein VN788_08560 [Verrucomicrobiae bacterium]|jgi:hypothetical protein|nr:hypothetical protein [Verrucomicrobiae bacterium]